MKCVKQKSTTSVPQSQDSPRTLPRSKVCEIPTYMKEQIHATIFPPTDPQGSAVHVMRLFQPGGQLEKQLQNIKAPPLYSLVLPTSFPVLHPSPEMVFGLHIGPVRTRVPWFTRITEISRIEVQPLRGDLLNKQLPERKKSYTNIFIVQVLANGFAGTVSLNTHQLIVGTH